MSDSLHQYIILLTNTIIIFTYKLYSGKIKGQVVTKWH